MEFTTQLELHSQTTRLVESASWRTGAHIKDGILTLFDTLFQETCMQDRHGQHFSRLQLGTVMYDQPPDLKFELFPLHSPLLRESLLVSFPPLIDMLKFSG
jgi:hypothetical protein